MKLDKEILQKIIKEYVYERISLRKLSKKYNISATSLSYWIKKSGGRIKERNEVSKFDIKIVNDAIQEYMNGTKPLKEISVKYNMSYAFLCKHMHDLGLKARDKMESYSKYDREIINKAIEEYFSSNKCLKEVSIIYNINPCVLRRRIIKKGLKTKPLGEKRIDPKIIDKAIEEYFNDKKSLYEVEKKYDMPQRALAKFIRERGFDIKENRGVERKFSDEIMNIAMKEYFDTKKSLDEIGWKYNMSGSCLLKWIKKSGLKGKSAGDHWRDYKIIKECGDLYLKGLTNKELSIKYNVSKRTILTWIEWNKIKAKKFSELCGITPEMKEMAIDLYVNKELNCCQIAKIIKCSSNAVFDWIKDVKRSASEIMSKVVLESGGINTRGKKGHMVTPFGIFYYASSYEKDRIGQISSDNSVRGFKRCGDLIPYVVDGKIHRYNPDFFIEYNNGSKVVEEIKPFGMIKYKNNLVKFKAAKKFYDKKMIFRVVTEQAIYGKNVSKIAKSIRRRGACKQHELIRNAA